MADDRPKSVKDVPAEKFITAFAAYLKQTNKVRRPGRRWRAPTPGRPSPASIMQHAGPQRPPTSAAGAGRPLGQA